MGWPPRAATALSVLTLVRVLRLLKVRAMVFPARDPRRGLGMEPDLKACLWDRAFRMRVVSSVLVRSAMLRRCRGAKGEVGGDGDDVELYALWGGFSTVRKHRRQGRSRGIGV